MGTICHKDCKCQQCINHKTIFEVIYCQDCYLKPSDLNKNDTRTKEEFKKEVDAADELARTNNS